MFSRKKAFGFFIFFLFSSLVLFQNCSGTNSGSSENPSSSFPSVSENASQNSEKVVFFEGFEESTSAFTDWRGNQIPQIILHQSATRTGAMGARINAQVETMHLFAPQSPQLVLNKTYRISFWARRVSFDSNSPVPFFDIYGAIGSGPHYGQSPIANTSWAQFEYFFTAISTELRMDFWIHLGSKNIVDIDDVTLVMID